MLGYNCVGGWLDFIRKIGGKESLWKRISDEAIRKCLRLEDVALGSSMHGMV
jgi:hypothetical protein